MIRTAGTLLALSALLATPAAAAEWESFLVSGEGPALVADVAAPALYRRDLAGAPQIFQFQTTLERTPLQVELLVPSTAEARRDLEVSVLEIRDADEVLLATLDGGQGTWEEIYTDPKRSLSYRRGPRTPDGFSLPAGTYEIRVQNTDNAGTYALAFGGVTAPDEESPEVPAKGVGSSLRLGVILGIIATLAGAAVYAQRKN